MYNVLGYGKMLGDGIRMDAYLEAMRRTVKPGFVVVDLGCGPGVFAMFACQLGAKRVYAIEPANIIQLARELAAANGFADRIQFFQDFSTNVTLAERADVIVSDLHGILPFQQRHIPAIVDVRERLLAPGGTLIPQSDTIWGTLVETREFYRRSILSWDAGACGFDLSQGRRMTANNMFKFRAVPEEYLAEPQILTTIDYDRVTDSRFRAEPAWTATRDGDAHGACLWFDMTLSPGVCFSNAPGLPEAIYGNTLFPFPEPLPVRAGDRIVVRIAADLVGDDYVWRWDTTLNGANRFTQSTFFGAPVPLEALKRAR